jgi:hypothetical protein
MNTPKRLVTLLEPLLQALIAVNLGMALQRLDEGLRPTSRCSQLG